jgi:hypothetical protein
LRKRLLHSKKRIHVLGSNENEWAKPQSATIEIEIMKKERLNLMRERETQFGPSLVRRTFA